MTNYESYKLSTLFISTNNFIGEKKASNWLESLDNDKIDELIVAFDQLFLSAEHVDIANEDILDDNISRIVSEERAFDLFNSEEIEAIWVDAVVLAKLVIEFETGVNKEPTDDALSQCLSNLWVLAIYERCRRRGLVKIPKPLCASSTICRKDIQLTEEGQLKIQSHSVIAQFENYLSKHADD